jgi:heme exporter protein C
MKRGFPILAVVTALLLSFALYEALIGAPTERSMGDVQRIFYYHVPSAWTAFLLFFITFAASITYLINRRPAADIVALTTAEVGVVFLTVSLVTGPIWARRYGASGGRGTGAHLDSGHVAFYVSLFYCAAFFRRAPVLAAAPRVPWALLIPFVYSPFGFPCQHPSPVLAGGSLDPRMAMFCY